MGQGRKNGTEREGWYRVGRMGQGRKDGTEQKGWDRAGRMGKVKKDRTGQKGWNRVGRKLRTPRKILRPGLDIRVHGEACALNKVRNVAKILADLVDRR